MVDKRGNGTYPPEIVIYAQRDGLGSYMLDSDWDRVQERVVGKIVRRPAAEPAAYIQLDRDWSDLSDYIRYLDGDETDLDSGWTCTLAMDCDVWEALIRGES